MYEFKSSADFSSVRNWNTIEGTKSLLNPRKLSTILKACSVSSVPKPKNESDREGDQLALSCLQFKILKTKRDKHRNISYKID